MQIKSLNEIGGKSISSLEKQKIKNFIDQLNSDGVINISRVFPFKDGNPQKYYYQFEHKSEFAKSELAKLLALEIVQICPFIIYFEDFKDRIPEEIFISENSDSYDPIWYDIIDGLFYNTKEEYNIENFKSLFNPKNQRLQESRIVLKDVNKTLNSVFTKRWKKLSGVKGIDSAELTYNHIKKYFQLTVYDSNSSNFTPEERSRGAIWYLSFLMKTEFRSKKLRKSTGMPVFLIDEPASNLHSNAQESMIKDFKILSKDTSILYTTHSQYLISLENIKNTYIISKSGTGLVKAEQWSEFLQKNQGKKKKESYYQPLANLLQLIPNSLTIPWENAIITEGPSDRKVLKIMRMVLDLDPVVIYPGTSAYNLENLISLNIGWNSNFKVLLDSDEAGIECAENYRKNFKLTNEIVTIPRPNLTIEDCFTKDEIKSLYKLAHEKDLESNKISKSVFDSIFSLLIINETSKTKIKNCLSQPTLKLFAELMDLLK